MASTDTRTVDPLGLVSSLGVLFLTLLVASGIAVPDVVNRALFEGNTLNSGRYAMTGPGLDTVASHDTEAIITLGSSLLQYATDGACITEGLASDRYTMYNFAISGANPYTEVLQIPKVVAAEPRMVVLDVGPNALWDFYESESLDEYIQFRFTILSLTLGLAEGEGPLELVRLRDRPYVAASLEEKMALTASYSQKALEDRLFATFHEELDAWYYDRQMPSVGGDGWFEYLMTPKFMPDKFETWNQSTVDAWFEANMSKRVQRGVYNPLPNGTLNHEALEYAVRELTQADIEVLLVASPHHPMVYPYLEAGQIDGHNATLAYFESTYGVETLNWFWEVWEQNMFRDSNHLGALGREHYCERMAEALNERLEV
jgi:hypothetical protein